MCDNDNAAPPPAPPPTDNTAEVIARQQAMLAALEKRMDAQSAPRSITAQLDEQQKEIARRVLELAQAQGLADTCPRLAEEDIRRIVQEVVQREVSMLGGKLTASHQQKLTVALLGFAIGVSQNATWDLLKLLFAHTAKMFMSGELTDTMHTVMTNENDLFARRENAREFFDQNYRALRYLRIETWSQLKVAIESSEVGPYFEEYFLKDLMTTFEAKLFAPPGT